MGFSWKSIGAIAGAIVGVALAIPTGGASLAMAMGLTIGTTGAVLGALGAAAVLGGAAGYLIGSSVDSLSPKLPSATYDGNRPYPTVKNNTPIAEAWGGPLAIAGNVIRANDPSDATWLKLLLAHCLGPIEEYLATFVNDKEFSTLNGTHYSVHGHGTTGQLPLQIDGVDIFSDKYCAFKGLAYSGYKFKKTSTDIGGTQPTIYEIIKGRQLIPISINAVEGTKTWSRNPADILWDYYRRYDKNFSFLDLDLLGYWAFNESSGTTAADSSKWGNDGTLTNFPASPWVAAQVGNGLQFGSDSGTNDYVTFGNDTPLSGIGSHDFSVSFKIRFTSVSGSNVYVFWKYQTSSNYVVIQLASGVLYVRARKGSTADVFFGEFGFSPATNTDYHIVVVFSRVNQTVSLYVNKVKYTDVTWNRDADISNTGNLQFGFSSNSFLGILDQVRVYGRALKFWEVDLLYNEGGMDENSFKSLQAYCDIYPVDTEGSPMRPPGPCSKTVRTVNQRGEYRIGSLVSYFSERLLGFDVTGGKGITIKTDSYGNYSPTYSFDITKDIVGTWKNNQWLSQEGYGALIPQRFNFDVGIPVIPKKLELINSHHLDTTYLTTGINEFTIQGSNTLTDFTDVLLSVTAGTWVDLGGARVATEHDVDSPVQTFLITGVTTAYRYYSLRITTSHGATYVGFRDAVLWASHPRFPFDFVLDNETKKNDFKKIVFSSFFGKAFRSQGKLKVGWEGSVEPDGAGGLQDKSVVHAFDSDNIVSITRSPRQRYNKIRVNYVNSHEKFKSDYVEAVDEPDMLDRGEVLFEETCNFIYNQQTARMRAKRHLKKSIYCKWLVTLEAKDDSSDVEHFDLVTITWAKFGWVAKEFLVKDKGEDLLGRTYFVLEEYFAGIYDDEDLPAKESYFSRLAGPNDLPPPVEDLDISDISYWDNQGNYAMQTGITYSAPDNNAFWSHNKYQYGIKVSGELLATSGESTTVYMKPTTYDNINEGDLIYVSGEYRTVFEKVGGDQKEIVVGKNITLGITGFSGEYVQFLDYPGKDTGAGYFTMEGRYTTPTINDLFFAKAISVNRIGIESDKRTSPYSSHQFLLTFEDVLDSLSSTGGRRLVPEGTYQLQDEYSFRNMNQNMTIEGVGRDLVQVTAATDKKGISFVNPKGVINLKGLSFKTNPSTASEKPFLYASGESSTKANNTATINIADIYFEGKYYGSGSYDDFIYVTTGDATLNIQDSKIKSGEIFAWRYNNFKAINNETDFCGRGYYILGMSGETVIQRNSVTNFRLRGMEIGAYLQPCLGTTLILDNPWISCSPAVESTGAYAVGISAGFLENLKVRGNIIQLHHTDPDAYKRRPMGISSNGCTGDIEISSNSVDIFVSGEFTLVAGINADSNNGRLVQNIIKVNNVVDTNPKYGIYATSMTGSTISGNKINMVNSLTKDTGIILLSGANYNIGYDNVTENCGSGVSNLGTGNLVESMDI